jgi:hypothetical protein
MSELKPCPFCGGEAEYREYDDSVWFQCSNFDCQATRVWKFDGRRDAAEDWNRRASGWISVEDGLPDECVSVLTLDHEHRPHINTLEMSYGDMVWADPCDRDLKIGLWNHHITHWMKLPEGCAE